MHNKGFIIVTFVFAFLLSIMKLPEWAIWVRLPWVPVLLLFWVLVFPQQIGIGIAWGLGLMLDALNGTLIGEHALGLAIITFLFLRFYRQIRMFPMMQQAVIVSILIALYQGFLFWVQHLIGQTIEGRLVLFPVMATLIIWPALCVFLNHRRH
jgi:rod shape-determining protein MreD